MKLFPYVIFFLFPLLNYAQGGITATSDNKDIRFYITIDGQQINEFWETEVTVKGLKPGYYLVKFIFEGDSIADAWRNILVKPQRMKTVKAIAKTEGQKKTGKTGRGIGKSLKIGKHDEEMAYLEDRYKLVIKSDNTCTDCDLAETEISVENSLSSSATPATKSKH